MQSGEKSVVLEDLSVDLFEEISDYDSEIITGGLFGAIKNAVKEAVKDKVNAVFDTAKGIFTQGSLPTGTTATNLIRPLPIGILVHLLNGK